MKERIVLIILDGWGDREEEDGNAIAEANTKNMDKYLRRYPSTLLEASGRAVGLPDGTPGFCEHSYFLIGTGKKSVWDHQKIMREIKTGKFKSRLDKVFAHSRIHIFAVLTENGIYSHIQLLKEVLKVARSKRKKHVYVHLILEGRESGPHSAYDLFQKWKDENIINHLASIVGGRYVLTRNIRGLVDEYLAVLSDPSEYYPSFVSALMTGYDHGENDFTLRPKVISPECELLEGDAALILGYRSNKWEALVDALLSIGLDVYAISYPSKPRLQVIYKTKIVKDGFLDQLARSKGSILKIGETEKGMNLEYFLTGGNILGDSVIFNSPATLDYSVTPEMKAPEITGETLKRIKEGRHDFIVVSFANPDVIAHTGNYDSLIKAIEIVDDGVGRIVRAAQKEDYVPVIVGDHGNAEEMYKGGKIYLGHTTNPVPFVIASEKYRHVRLASSGTLLDVPATLSKIFGKRFKTDGKALF